MSVDHIVKFMVLKIIFYLKFEFNFLRISLELKIIYLILLFSLIYYSYQQNIDV